MTNLSSIVTPQLRGRDKVMEPYTLYVRALRYPGDDFHGQPRTLSADIL